MLSRHAEDLFWIGRYVERAEDSARMLDVTYHGLLESPAVDAGTAWRELLEVLYLTEAFGDRPLDGRSVSHFLVLDQDNAGSIVAAVARARENARGVRDRISTELWEAINRFYLELSGMDLRHEITRQPYEVFRMVKNRCQMISGVAAQTMPRDDGYRFIVLGHMLERAEMTCRLLAVRYARLANSGRQMAFHAWAAVLRSVSAFEAYLKEYNAALDPVAVLEFLLLSPDFPRSTLYTLRVAEQMLDRLVGGGPRLPVQRAIGRVRARIEFCDIGEILDDGLDQFLEQIQEDIWAVAETIDAHFFRVGTDLELHAFETA